MVHITGPPHPKQAMRNGNKHRPRIPKAYNTDFFESRRAWVQLLRERSYGSMYDGVILQLE